MFTWYEISIAKTWQNTQKQPLRVFLEWQFLYFDVMETQCIILYNIQHYPVNVSKKKRQKKATKDKKGQRKKRSYTYMYTLADRTIELCHSSRYWNYYKQVGFLKENESNTWAAISWKLFVCCESKGNPVLLLISCIISKKNILRTNTKIYNLLVKQ